LSDEESRSSNSSAPTEVDRPAENRPTNDSRADDDAPPRQSLDETLALLESIVEGAPSAIFAKDLAGRYTLMNTLAAEFLGWDKAEILGKTDGELFSPEVTRTYVDGDRRVLETGEPISYNEENVPAPDGAWQYRLVTKGPVRDKTGALAGVFGITSDLTAPIFAEKAIAQAARHNEQLARAAMSLIECASRDHVFDVIVRFFSEVVRGSLVIVNESVDDGRSFLTRHITGADESILRRAGQLVGFDLIGRKYPVTDEYRREFFSTTLTKVDGGFAQLSGSEVPRMLVPILEATFGLRDAYTIGIRSDGAEYGSVHIITRSADESVPTGIIDAFVRQCVLALSAITHADEIVAYQERLESLLEEREQHAETLAFALTSVIEVVSRTVEMRDPYTAGHQKRVAALAERIARECGKSETDIEDIRIAALMHDVGKVSVPAEILSKPGQLTEPEFALVKNHATAGYEIVRAAHMRGPIAEIIYQHHERCDGSGYPLGLDAERLHSGAKVIMVADVVEAMASHRPYRAIVGLAQAREEIERGSGTLYDPEVVSACLAVIDGGFAFDPAVV